MVTKDVNLCCWLISDYQVSYQSVLYITVGIHAMQLQYAMYCTSETFFFFLPHACMLNIPDTSADNWFAIRTDLELWCAKPYHTIVIDLDWEWYWLSEHGRWYCSFRDQSCGALELHYKISTKYRLLGYGYPGEQCPDIWWDYHHIGLPPSSQACRLCWKGQSPHPHPTLPRGI